MRKMALVVGRSLAIALVVAFCASGAFGQSVCPEGQNEMANVEVPGCFLCSETEGCDVVCVGTPACLCEGPDAEECCDENPCCDGCPDSDAPICDVVSCSCSPEECCSLRCPGQSMAPVADPPMLALTALVLAAVGIGVLVKRGRRPTS